MTSADDVVANGWIVLIAMICIGLVPMLIWFAYMARMILRFSREAAINVSPNIQCVECGKTYHRDWGSMCPDCSGAD